MELKDLYTPLEEAREEIHRRFADQDLRREVEVFLGDCPGIGAEPRAFLFRTVQTPNREFFRFAERASEIGLPPAAQEYLDDHFHSMNPDKLALVRMTFLRGMDRQGQPIFRRLMVTAGDNGGCPPFSVITTKWGENLIDFHHRLLRQFFPAIDPVNDSDWIRSFGAIPSEFYPANFARFICHGVLFENYLENRHEAAFTRDIVLPTFESIQARFGMKPLVVLLVPEESAEDISWSWYDNAVEALVARHFPAAEKKPRSQ